MIYSWLCYHNIFKKHKFGENCIVHEVFNPLICTLPWMSILVTCPSTGTFSWQQMALHILRFWMRYLNVIDCCTTIYHCKVWQYLLEQFMDKYLLEHGRNISMINWCISLGLKVWKKSASKQVEFSHLQFEKLNPLEIKI